MAICILFRANDIDRATAAKFEVEQKQRAEAKTRKDANALFDNKVCNLHISYLFNL